MVWRGTTLPLALHPAPACLENMHRNKSTFNFVHHSKAWITPQIRQIPLLPHPFQFIIYLSSCQTVQCEKLLNIRRLKILQNIYWRSLKVNFNFQTFTGSYNFVLISHLWNRVGAHYLRPAVVVCLRYWIGIICTKIKAFSCPLLAAVLNVLPHMANISILI